MEEINISFLQLEELVSQGQIEFADAENNDLRLIYLMNDAVESFLVPENARMTGSFDSSCSAAVSAELSDRSRTGEYGLIMRQGDNVSCLFFTGLKTEIHLYNYSGVGHFWVKGWEYLRVMEYQIAIVEDKLRYLGEDCCSPVERKLAKLRYFPPLNECSYASVPVKYRTEIPIITEAFLEAADYMLELAGETGDRGLQRLIKQYKRHSGRVMTMITAAAMRRQAHRKTVELLRSRISEAASVYADRCYSQSENAESAMLHEKAILRKAELEKQGFSCMLYREEPFIESRDDVKFRYYILYEKNKGFFRKVYKEELVR